MRRTVIGLLAVAALVTGCNSDPPAAVDEGTSDGTIRVHGDWTIDIFDADGTIDQHLEFTNALTDAGADALASVLARQQVVGPWEIELDGIPRPCLNSSGTPVTCIGVEAGNGQVPAGNNKFDTLTVTELPGAIRLLTTITVQADSALDDARTSMRVCDPDQSPNECFAGASGFSPFTLKDLTQLDLDGNGTPDGPIDVTADQVVQVAVDISFSSG